MAVVKVLVSFVAAAKREIQGSFIYDRNGGQPSTQWFCADLDCSSHQEHTAAATPHHIHHHTYTHQRERYKVPQNTRYIIIVLKT